MNMVGVKLTVALATTGARAQRVDPERLPASPHWHYVVYCQHDEDSPGSALEAWATRMATARPDVSVTFLSSRGVAASRNAALEACETEILLFTDDDVRLRSEGIVDVLEAFTTRPDIDLIAGRALAEDGLPRKQYPRVARRLSLFNCARIGTVELAVRANHVRIKGILFDPDFGAGQPNFLGDEYIFVTDCLKAGLQGVYLPITVAIHGGVSSGADFQTEASARARARVFERVFGMPLAQLVKLAFLWRHRRRLGSLREGWNFARSFLAVRRD